MNKLDADDDMDERTEKVYEAMKRGKMPRIANVKDEVVVKKVVVVEKVVEVEKVEAHRPVPLSNPKQVMFEDLLAAAVGGRKLDGATRVNDAIDD